MRTKILAVVAGLGVAGLVAASAAQLNVTSDNLGAGVEVVASCIPSTNPANGVNVAYTGFAYDDEITPLGGADVTQVTVDFTGVADWGACLDQEITVILAGAAAAELGQGSNTIDNVDDPVVIPITPAADYVSAEEVLSVAVVITGPAS